MNEGCQLRVIPPETVARWRREERVCQVLGKIAVGMCWWGILMGTLYVAALVIGAGWRA